MPLPRRALPHIESGRGIEAAVGLLGPRQAGKTTLAMQIASSRPAVCLGLERGEDRAAIGYPPWLPGFISATISRIDKALARIRRNPRDVRFDDLRRVCDHYFGQPRARGSHLVYKTPWKGEPLVNIQSVKGMAKPYQVRQVIKAIAHLEEDRHEGT